MTRHYEGPHKELFAAAEAEARVIAGLTPRVSARLIPRPGMSPGSGAARTTAGAAGYPQPGRGVADDHRSCLPR